MFLPISQYYLYPSQKPNNQRKKALKPQNLASFNDVNQNEENLLQSEQNYVENATHPSIATAEQYEELSVMSSSTSSSSSSSIDHSNSI